MSKNVKYIGGYKVEYLNDTDKDNSRVLDDSIYNSYEYSNKPLPNPIEVLDTSGMYNFGGGIVVIGILLILLIFRR